MPSIMRRNDTTKLVRNKKMNDETYALRREAMKFVYEAKELVGGELPRITVRIAEKHNKTLGVGRMGQNIIWITDEAITNKRFDLRTLVFHELLHAVYAVDHDESCPLMKSVHTPLTKSQAQKLFKKWAA